jgi:hypothetical protein
MIESMSISGKVKVQETTGAIYISQPDRSPTYHMTLLRETVIDKLVKYYYDVIYRAEEEEEEEGGDEGLLV